MKRTVDVLTLGESMVSFRSQGPLSQGGAFTAHLAGAESNVAIGLARLGHTAAWAGRVGADEFGDLVLRELRAEGVSIDYVVRDPQRLTGLMFLEQRTADLSRVHYRRSGSAGCALTADDARPALSADPTIVHLTGITPAISLTARECVVWVAESVSAANGFLSLDVNYRGRLWARDEARATLVPLAAHARLVIASDDELDVIAPAAGDEETMVSSLLEVGVEQVAVKRGRRGATLWTRDGRVDAPAVPVTAIDTVGAGDAFTAGYLSGVLDGLPVAGRLRRATVAGAFAVSTRGDWRGLPRRDELSLLDDHERGATLR